MRFLWSGQAETEPLLAPLLHLWVIFKHPSFISRNDVDEKFRVILDVLECVLTDLHSLCFLVI